MRENSKPRRTVLALLELLKKNTDRTRPMHINEMVDLLSKSEYTGVAATRDTVRHVLTDLMDFYPELHCEELQRTQNNERNRYTYGYWFEQPFALKEAEQHVPEQVIENVKAIRKVIEKNEELPDEYTLSFIFNGYGTNAKPHPTGKGRVEHVLPLKVCAAYGHFYLIGLFVSSEEDAAGEDNTNLAHFRLDLMTDTVVVKRKVSSARKNLFYHAQNRLVDMDFYIHSHLYMSYEKDGDGPINIVLRVRKWKDRPDASCTFLYDAFGKWETSRDTEESIDAKVLCTKYGIKKFVWQYPDRIEKIVSPPGLWEEVQNDLREEYEKYFLPNEMRKI